MTRQAHDHLADIVRGLDLADLGRPSACAYWTLAQVLGHLGSAAEIGVATFDAAGGSREASRRCGPHGPRLTSGSVRFRDPERSHR